ncbi:hypothetical protein PFISCL1PPCAC_28765, partial [Pristionchus fissidentatus]
SRSLYSTMSRQAWHDGELRTMASFVYEFVNGRFDSELKGVNAAEREMVKKQPCGNKIWEYLESLQQSTNWDLGFVNHFGVFLSDQVVSLSSNSTSHHRESALVQGSLPLFLTRNKTVERSDQDSNFSVSSLRLEVDEWNPET